MSSPRPFREQDRWSYALDHESTVFDVGAFEGNFSAVMSSRYGCRILAFEPIARFHAIARKTLRPFPNATLHLHGLAGSTREEVWHVKGAMTGAFNRDNDELERVVLIDVNALLDYYKPLPDVIDLLKLNVEGMEFEILDALIKAGTIARFRHLQVQFHSCVAEPVAKWEELNARLLASHELVYHEPFVWSGYTLR